MSQAIPLDRRFVRWTSEESADAEVARYLSGFGDSVGWDELLKHRRVVVLAEPGSGKSTEIDMQIERSYSDNQYTFAATVQSIARDGMDRALGRRGQHLLEEWRRSEQPGWFFFDAVDEAKAGDFRFEDALREIADAIEGCRGRTHIVLTGRDANWEIGRDFERMLKHLALPPPDRPPPDVDPNELVVAVVRREHQSENSEGDDGGETAEEPLIVRMVPLDRDRIERFARAREVNDTNEFLRAIDRSDLGGLASRPIDLDWLIDYWNEHGRFGTFAEMLELSLKKRLLEIDPDRGRRDPLDRERAMRALERIGAALVLRRERDLAVPDAAAASHSAADALRPDAVLPDWSGAELNQLISRAVFVPSSAGYLRLYNDNEGEVRGYLAARWLYRLLAMNCDKAEVFAILFADTYGVSLVIPSMRQTAAWLSLWNADVAREVVERDPRLLMDAGDPAGLPLETREAALRAVVDRSVNDEYFEIPDRQSVRRFGQSDMESCGRALWAEYSTYETAREVLLTLIWLGDLGACCDLAVAASFGAYTDRYTPMFAGQAVLAHGNAAEKQRYATYVRDNAAQLLSVVTWDAVRALFPNLMSVDDLLHILSAIDAAGDDDSLGFDYYGPKLVYRLDDPDRVTQLLQGLLNRLDASERPENEVESSHDEQYLATIEACARRLLQLSSGTEAPELAIDTALRLGEEYRHGGAWRRRVNVKNLLVLLRETPERRRLALWRAAGVFNRRPRRNERPITGLWQFRPHGFHPDILFEDLDWLLDDIVSRAEPNERKIATDAAMTIWKHEGEDTGLLARLQTLGESDADVAAVIEEWTRIREPTDEERDCAAQDARRAQERKEKRDNRDQSWRDFADEVRANPERVRNAVPSAEGQVDSWLYSLWQMLDGLGENRGHHAIGDLSGLVPLFGHSVVEALREALIGFWRHFTPTLASERPAEKRNVTYHFDCMALVGITLEAETAQDWAGTLTHEEAVLAACYAMNELNGFPEWLEGLARKHPAAVREVLLRASPLERAALADDGQFMVLADIARAGDAVGATIAFDLYELLEAGATMHPAALKPILKIIAASYEDRVVLKGLLVTRFRKGSDWAMAAHWIAALYDLDGKTAIDELVAKLKGLAAAQRKALMEAVLANLFSRWEDRQIDVDTVPFESLLVLIRAAYRTVRIVEDNVRPSGKAYSPNQRDDAESARSMLLRTLFETPGLATFEALHQLGGDPSMGLKHEYMVRRALERALQDSEQGLWSSDDVYEFENTHLTAPHTSRDLQQLAIRRIDDFNYDLSNSDFSNGAFLASLPQETDVQIWISDELRKKQGRNYSVEREPELADAKKPDIRFEAKATDARVQLEIKVANDWTLAELEEALQAQLIQQYLRDRRNHYGILLIVLKAPRKRGWRSPDGSYWNFDQVIRYLRQMAREIAVSSPSAPQADVVVIDVSANAVSADDSGDKQ
ncbi:MAG: hypothetical protein WD078_06810 [Woeseia sp.]